MDMMQPALLAGLGTMLLMLTWVGGIILAAVKWRSCPRAAAITLTCALTLLLWQILSFLLTQGMSRWFEDSTSMLVGFQLVNLLGCVVHAAVYVGLGYAIFAGRDERSVG
ncbi:hypothetical protein [Pseudomonas mangrovi]|uniref:Uncharacterized protein n=1 Tax=Pseudomonas mangrovi TaxID=2161748 RepID=A0A2T5P763_9PSED|nr:hypothetical protein [Pseudomonas mangrovi]PTU73547.1 hypothetical protein DBO85_14620 [Pseudomonas mangrovi]